MITYANRFEFQPFTDGTCRVTFKIRETKDEKVLREDTVVEIYMTAANLRELGEQIIEKILLEEPNAVELPTKTKEES